MFFKWQILFELICIKLTKFLYTRKIVPIRKVRLVALMERLQRSPFYKRQLALNKNFEGLPIINKETFMAHFNEINSKGFHLEECMDVAIKAEMSRDFSPMIDGVSVGLSTGTSGNRGLFLVSKKERAVWVATVLDRVIGFSFKKRKVAFFLRANNNLYQSTQSKLLKFSFYDIFLPMENHLEKLQAQNPDIIVAQPSVLSLIADAIESGQMNIFPKKVISVAEVLTPDDREYLERVFHQQMHQVYQCTEGFLAASCKYGTLHFNEDFILIEKKYLNPEKTKFHPIITDLLRTSQPVVRYELNDIVTVKEECPCGSKMLAIESIEGRSDDILKFTNKVGKNVMLFPDLLRRTIVLADSQLMDYCLTQTASHLLHLYIQSDQPESYEIVSTAILSLLSDYQIQDVQIIKKETNPFVLGNKKRRIRNEVPKTY